MKHADKMIGVGKLIGLVVSSYGIAILAGTLLHIGLLHPGHIINALFSGLTPLVGVSYVYIGSLLVRRKRNAWWAAIVLSILAVGLNGWQLLRFAGDDTLSAPMRVWARVVLPLIVLLLLVASRRVFIVRSDLRSFQQALRTSTALLLVVLMYGTTGFMLLDRHDLGHEVSVFSAVDQTVDQFGLTTRRPVAHSHRARVFLDSLPVLSLGTLVYVALSFFQPLRVQFVHRSDQRERVERLLREYPSDLDDYFKLWPHDKQYFFSISGDAGLAYRVSRGVALVVGDPFGDRKQYGKLIRAFQELCFVNDWLPAFIHASDRYHKLYENCDMTMQKIGEEAIVNVEAFAGQKMSKYFRQINNRFAKLGYVSEFVMPPHNQDLMTRLRTISDDWLSRPGRVERGFMLGYFSVDYLQGGPLLIARDANGVVQGFINMVPTFESASYNYDLMRCSNDAPGNCNDFMVLSLLVELAARGGKLLNLGLCPLSGLDKSVNDATVIDATLRFLYANGDRLYSFSGLHRFKAKYDPDWQPRYIVYSGGIRNFGRIVAAFNRVSKLK